MRRISHETRLLIGMAGISLLTLLMLFVELMEKDLSRPGL
jgi:hypothetical protein